MDGYEYRALRRAQRRMERERHETLVGFTAGVAFIFGAWLLFYITGAVLRML